MADKASRRRLRLAAVLVIVACVSPDRPASAQAGRAPAVDTVGVVAFERVTVVPMDRERLLADQTVVVRGGRIAAMGPRRLVQVPAGAVRVDGRGRYLMPGLADMHVHPYNADQFVNHLAHGVTTIAVLNGTRAVLGWRDRVRRGEMLGPTIYTAGPSLDGVPAGNPLFLSTATPEAGRLAVRAIADAGYDFVKVYMSLTPETYAAIIAEARAARIPVVAHIPPRVTVDGVLSGGGVAAIAHAEEFFRERVDSARMPARMAEIVRGVKAAKLTVIPNMAAYVDYIRMIKDLPAVLGDPEMRFASPAAYSEKIPSHNRSIRPNPKEFLAGAERGLARFHLFTRALRDARVPMLLGTDTEIFGYAGEVVHEELRQMVVAGLSPYEALVTGTRAAGEFIAANLRDAERFGTVAVGQRAELLLLAGNPLLSVDNAHRIEGVMVRGRWLPAPRLAEMRDSLAARHTPRRADVLRFDSLVTAGSLDEAAATFREMRQAHAGSTPVSHVVMWVKAQRLLAANAAGAVRLLEWNAEMYPELHSSHAELARGYLAVGDTVNAVAAARRSLAIFPTHATALDVLQRAGQK